MQTSSIWRIAALALLAAATGFPMAAVEAADPGAPPCRCRYAGERYDQGRCVCMMTPAGPRRACCGKVLNNASWIFGKGTCPVARNAPDRDRRARAAVAISLAEDQSSILCRRASRVRKCSVNQASSSGASTSR